MARWVRRMPRTLRARIQFENWMLRLRAPSYTYTQISRLARMVELYKPADQDLYSFLRGLHPDLVDLTNPVLTELGQRRIRRDLEGGPPASTPVLRLASDGSLFWAEA